MKKFLAVLLMAGMVLPVFSQVKLPEHFFASGDWALMGTRLYQNDDEAPLAKVNIRVPQSGAMVYAFNARYESGAEDGHGGFGVHLFADKIHERASWGSGNSYLLWLNYDENPVSSGIPAGFSAQVYRSTSNSSMKLVESIDLNQYRFLITEENLSQPIPVKIVMNGETGQIKVYDPTDPTYYYYFYIDAGDVPMKGDWIALRTNGIRLSFGLPQ